jgi:cytochrome c oxidase assembly protein subunit 15
MTRSIRHPWLDRFAWFTAAATFLLLGLGGLVTSHEAGLAVPDWPTSYGYNMFLFPMRFWQCNIFYEHTHRLLASFVGLLTSILAVWLWLRESRSWLRWLGVSAFLAILLQGLLGGLRVTLLKDEIGIFHAALAQSFFVLVTLIALFGSVKAGRLAGSLQTAPI